MREGLSMPGGAFCCIGGLELVVTGELGKDGVAFVDDAARELVVLLERVLRRCDGGVGVLDWSGADRFGDWLSQSGDAGFELVQSVLLDLKLVEVAASGVSCGPGQAQGCRSA